MNENARIVIIIVRVTANMGPLVHDYTMLADATQPFRHYHACESSTND
jgi:hypothetical protein